MRAADGKDLTQGPGGRRRSRPRRGPLAAALLGIALLCCLFVAAAPAGAAAADVPAEALLAQLALQQAELTAGDGAANDYFGFSVAISGETALIGAPYRDIAGQADAGAVYVFTRSGGVWTQQQMLSAAAGAAGDRFGYAVALSGETALVGAPYRDTAGQADAGAAYVFTRSGGAWTPQQMLSAGDGAAGDSFGISVALSGETALVGAPWYESAGPANAGGAYILTRSAGSWTQQQMLSAADGAADDSFGYAVALSGETALASALGHDTAGLADTGAAYVFATVAAPTITLKLNGLTSGAIKLGKSVTAQGAVTPPSLAGSMTTLKVQKKSGTKWVSRYLQVLTIGATDSYSWKNKPAKGGVYRMQAKIAETAAHAAATTPWRTFKVT